MTPDPDIRPAPDGAPERDRYSRELSLLEQVHNALGLASKLDDFYVIVASLMVDANAFGFSRVFLLRHDDPARSFRGRLALGARDAAEHARFRDEQAGEDAVLRRQVEAVQLDSPEPVAAQPFYDLRYHGLWIQLLQGIGEGTGMNAGFLDVELVRDHMPADHLVELAAKAPSALMLRSGEARRDGLSDLAPGPVLAGRLVTKRGLHGILVVDRAFDTAPLDDEALYHFQWMLNQASIALDNVELVAELTETTERLKEVDRLKTNFLSIVSHELRTPLTSIVGFVHLLAEEKVGPVAPPQRDLLKRVAGHATHLQSMVNDLLEIAEVEAGGIINVALVAIDPLTALLNIMPKIEGRRAARKAEIVPVLHAGVPLVRADQSALERVLYHLLDNAVKFTPEGGKVLVEFASPDARHLDISVQDSGIGIPTENLEKIFTHFFQVDGRLERAYGGMGIGLTTVKLLLRATGGRIRVESSPGKGSRFTVTYVLAESTGYDAEAAC